MNAPKWRGEANASNVWQAFMAGVPRLRFLRTAIERIADHVRTRRRFPKLQSWRGAFNQGMLKVTGPGARHSYRVSRPAVYLL